ncbi:rCG55857 [Rattus norvegicus]|uniref:RCG55857 n=1 Tax=Rattus norvegicus TaxID=10116 RepID=A6JM84_RAT|nr:rCG55857 [Rattus norvegicus]
MTALMSWRESYQAALAWFGFLNNKSQRQILDAGANTSQIPGPDLGIALFPVKPSTESSKPKDPSSRMLGTRSTSALDWFSSEFGIFAQK